MNTLKNINEKVDELIINYGKWAKRNRLLQDNSILAYLYSERLNCTLSPAISHDEMYSAVRYYILATDRNYELYNAMITWEFFFRAHAHQTEPFVYLSKPLKIGEQVEGLFFSDGIHVVKTYGIPLKAYSVDFSGTIVILCNGQAYRVVTKEEDAEKYVDISFAKLCHWTLLGINAENNELGEVIEHS